MSGKRPNALELWKQLERSNCGECGAPTCMAFAALVVQGAKRLVHCPRLPEGLREQYADRLEAPAAREEYGRELMEGLMSRVAALDFDEVAARLGGRVRQGRLGVHCLGRVFELDRQGRLYSQCHVFPWVHAPILEYVLHSAGRDPTGEWKIFAELGHTGDWIRFYEHRCEQGFLKVADREPQLFSDLLKIFGGRPVADPGEGRFSDGALVVYPLPKIPLLISHWPDDGELGSQLSLLFDATAEQNLPAESLYRLTQGLVDMFRKLYVRHGAPVG